MFFVFRIVVILSMIGTAATVLLMALKPITSRAFSAKWQYYIWAAVLVIMVFPIPLKTEKASLPEPPTFLMPAENIQTEQTAESGGETAEHRLDWRNGVSLAWAAGACIYILSALVSYHRFLARKKRGSYAANIDISAVAAAVGLKKTPPVRICADTSPPMLVGVIKPVIYLPDMNFDDGLHMVLMHELTHYKRRDLFYKWAALIVNGIHWFNPAAYMVTANINEACEISCDAAVTRNMSSEEKKKYMQTILNLIHK